LLSSSGFSEGNLLVFVPGSTAGLTTIEYESGLKRDLKEFFEKWIPMKERYYHNERWHDGNGYAHVRAAMLKPSLIIPFSRQRLSLGTWQQVILVDFDNRPRHRELIVQFNGKKQ
jgi:secondary thiamine-phosphate synthase enzyme